MSSFDIASDVSLDLLHDDILISALTWLAPPDLLSVRKTCKRFHDISRTRIVWTNACHRCVLALGYPFPNVPLDSLSVESLERSTCNAYRLGHKWRSRGLTPRTMHYVYGVFSAAISDVRFVPGHGDKWLVTISKSIWSVLAVWHIAGTGTPQKRGEWSPKGAIFKGFCLNTDANSEATLAIALQHGGKDVVYILSLKERDDGTVKFETVTSVVTRFMPMTLHGDILALSNDLTQTAIWNWRSNEYAMLHNTRDEEDTWQHNICTQVLIEPENNFILVVRDRSIHLFPYPELTKPEQPPSTYSAIANHAFGLIDGIAATFASHSSNETDRTNDHPPNRPMKPISILSRQKSRDPWHSDTYYVRHYSILPNPDYDPDTPLPKGSPESEPTPIDFHPTTTIPPPATSTLTATATSSPNYNPKSAAPYLFPPIFTTHITPLRGSLGGSLPCTNLILGRHGTAVWISPRDRAAAGLYWSDDESPLQIVPYVERSNERLLAAVFRGSMVHRMPDRDGEGGENAVKSRVQRLRESRERELRERGEVDKWTICVNDRNNWTSLDYDEDTGRVALGTSSGDLTILVL
ncbi:hypothetical protein AX17_002758 [Amanita inopinata Kibby_2008]|nr:hypothetical protein AX17_002758 [Amanita inopinata Kibby_2008]